MKRMIVLLIVVSLFPFVSGGDIITLGTVNASEFCIGVSCITSWEIGGGDISGTGTANRLAYWTGSDSIAALDAGTSGQFLKSGGSSLASWGTIAAEDVPNLDASKITSGSFAVNRGGTGRTSLTSGNLLVGAGTNAVNFLAPGTAGQVVRSTGSAWASTALQAGDIPNLDASKITSGIFNAARIPNLAASKITSGTFHVDRIPNLNANKITTGTFPAGISANTPTADAHIATKAHVDAAVGGAGGGQKVIQVKQRPGGIWQTVGNLSGIGLGYQEFYSEDGSKWSLSAGKVFKNGSLYSEFWPDTSQQFAISGTQIQTGNGRYPRGDLSESVYAHACVCQFGFSPISASCTEIETDSLFGYSVWRTHTGACPLSMSGGNLNYENRCLEISCTMDLLELEEFHYRSLRIRYAG